MKTLRLRLHDRTRFGRTVKRFWLAGFKYGVYEQQADGRLTATMQSVVETTQGCRVFTIFVDADGWIERTGDEYIEKQAAA